MAPSEESILSKFLLSPASLPTVISLQKFTELFPKRLRSHPQIKVLYRELQQLREQDMDLVNENIDKEVRRGEKQKAELRKALTATGVDGINQAEQREMDMDLQLFGQTSSRHPDEFHTLSSLLFEMEAACTGLEREIASVETEAATTLAELNTIVGDMSDLRYGKLNKPAGDVVSEAIKGLKSLEDSCNQANLP
ncbi:hypothetical protein VTN00DRAFT_10203 [Thermoascus crustaceus]|uniref:uncharacterized protein n=1 Tax=Thermoascus crustaceus TaxID=5088 RepID=UPI003742AAB1